MKPNPINELKKSTSNKGKVKNTNLKYNYEKKYFWFTVINDEEISTENYFEKSPKGHFIKMLPNPEVGVPFIYAYDKFNKEIKKLEELKDRDTSNLSRSKSKEKAK